MVSFQTLPLVIIEIILSKFQNSVTKWADVGSLLYTCRSWRAACFCFLCETFNLTIRKGMIWHTIGEWPEKMDKCLRWSPSRCRTFGIWIAFPMTSVDIGRQLQQYNNFVLDNAYHLDLRIDNYPTNLITEQDVKNMQTNIAILLQHIKQVAPNVVDVTLECSPNYSNHPFTAQYIQLLYQLLEPVTGMVRRRLSLEIQESSVLFDPCCLGIDDHALTYIKLEGTLKPQSIRLIHKCSGTLQQLHFHDYSKTSIRYAELILKDGKPMVYPKMTSLYVASWNLDETIQQLPRFPKTCIPFPQLRKLSIVDSYPFGDDVLFRGHQLTLQSLILILNSKLVDVLVKHRVFSATSHLNLQQVKLIDKGGILSETPKDGFIELVANITTHARDIKVTKKWNTGDWLKPIEAQDGMWSNARRFSIEDPHSKFSDIIRLFKVPRCPLVYLECLSPEIDVDLKELANNPLNEDINVLRISNTPVLCHLEEAVTGVIALAVSCPNLTRLKLPFISWTDGFERVMDEVLAQDEYKQHAEWIRSIADMSEEELP